VAGLGLAGSAGVWYYPPPTPGYPHGEGRMKTTAAVLVEASPAPLELMPTLRFRLYQNPARCWSRWRTAGVCHNPGRPRARGHRGEDKFLPPRASAHEGERESSARRVPGSRR